MNVLLPGHEPEDRVWLLLQLTSIESEEMISALKDHLVKGQSPAVASLEHGIDKSNFNRSLKRVNKKAQVVEKIKEIDWANKPVKLLKVVSKVTTESAAV